jgi:hypothetical protein
MDSSNKKNWLMKLTDITNQEKGDFINFIRDPLNHDNVNQNNVLYMPWFHYFTAKQEKK